MYGEKKGMGVGKKSASRCAVHAIKGLCDCVCVCVCLGVCVRLWVHFRSPATRMQPVCVCVCGFIQGVVFFFFVASVCWCGYVCVLVVGNYKNACW